MPDYDLIVNDVVLEALPAFIASLPPGAEIQQYVRRAECPTCGEAVSFLLPSPSDHRFTRCEDCRDRGAQ